MYNLFSCAYNPIVPLLEKTASQCEAVFCHELGFLAFTRKEQPNDSREACAHQGNP